MTTVPASCVAGHLDRPALLPADVLMALAGISLVRRTPVARFFDIIHDLMLMVGLKLAYDGLPALARSAAT